MRFTRFAAIIFTPFDYCHASAMLMLLAAMFELLCRSEYVADTSWRIATVDACCACHYADAFIDCH